MLNYFLLVFTLPYVLGSSTVERNARVTDHTVYFTELVQETIYEWERRGFCNLTIDEFTRPVNVTMFSWQILGNVTYTNAFLISIQKLEVSGMAQFVERRTFNNESVPFAEVRGTLFLRDSLFGYDVIFEQLNEGVHRYTGTYGYTRTEITLEILKNLRTNELFTTAVMRNLSGGHARMAYMPSNNITEVLSREFSPITTADSIRNWGTNTLAPMMLEIARTKFVFPEVCYSNTC